MINAILKGIMSMIVGLVSVILAPIDAIITTALPGLDSAFTAIGNMFKIASNYIGFAVSMTGLSNETLSLIVLFYTFKLTVPLMISSVKSAIKWYDKIKP
ncbi:MAG: hypothetical protein HFI08_04025 [Bacilli bacterium]|nr:hypothetical protein [Bacilli bacterium]